MHKLKFSINQVFCYALILVTYLFSSFSSPFYETNPWVDTNAMMTMGRAWLHGMLPFRDLFEQRGPTMYFIYLIGARISETNFLGVFLLELLAGLISYYLLVNIASLYLGVRKTSYWIALASFSIFIASTTFRFGGSPEEFTVPFLLGLLYLVLLRVKKDDLFSNKDLFIQGMCFAFVFWLKYSLVGAYIGFFFYLGVHLLFSKNWKRLCKVILFSVGGFLTVTLPILIYYFLQNGLQDLFEVYFKVNLNSYSKNGQGLEKISAIFEGMVNNFSPHLVEDSLFIIAFIFLLFYKKISFKVKGLLFSIFFFELFFVYFSGHPYFYYFLPFIAFDEVIVLLLVITVGEKIHLSEKVIRFIQVTLCVVLLGMNIYRISIPTTVEDQEYAETIKLQKTFTKTMKEDDKGEPFKLLQFGRIDQGFYLSTQTLPAGKYFENPNIHYDKYPAIIDGQLEQIKDKKVKYVVLSPYNVATRTFSDVHTEHFEAVEVEGKTLNVPKILTKNYKILSAYPQGKSVYVLFKVK